MLFPRFERIVPARQSPVHLEQDGDVLLARLKRAVRHAALRRRSGLDRVLFHLDQYRGVGGL